MSSFRKRTEAEFQRALQVGCYEDVDDEAARAERPSTERLRALCEGNRGYVEVRADELRELLDEVVHLQQALAAQTVRAEAFKEALSLATGGGKP